MNEFRFVTGKIKIEVAFDNLDLLFRDSLKGNVKPGVYLFKASCGLGKSKAVQSFLQTWKATGYQDQESVLIVLPTTDEIRAYIERVNLNIRDYAVYSSDEYLNSRGCTINHANDAPILYITHEMFKRRLTRKKDKWGGSYKAAEEFYYKGQPRSFIIYDETLSRAQELALSYDNIAALPNLIRSTNPTVTALIETALPDKASLSTFLPVSVPSDLADELQAARIAFEPLLSKPMMSTIDGLIAAAGTDLLAVRDNQSGWHLIGACNALPTDLPPVFVLDGSVGLRGTYDAWRAHDDKVKLLEGATASYEHTKLHWWDRGCGVGSLGNVSNRYEILGAIADLINGKPEERWLVIHPMDRGGHKGFAIPKELGERLHTPALVSFTHWGRHVATNEFRDIRNVIVMGENCYRDQSYDALYMAASGKRIASKAHREAIRLGEFAHHTYQGICRSNVRQIIDGVAGHVEAYLITTHSDAKEAMLLRAFGGCTIHKWQPVEGKPPTKAEKLIMQMEQVFTVEKRASITIRDLAIRCGGTVGKYLTRQWDEKGVVQYLETHNLIRDTKRVSLVLDGA